MGQKRRFFSDQSSESFKKRIIEQPGVVIEEEDDKISAELATLFPTVEAWRRALPEQDWRPIGVDVLVADYGMAHWNDHALKAIAMQARVQIVSRERGKYDEACFLVATIVDGEFQRFRDPLEAPCDDDAEDLGRWKVGHRLESRWLAQ